MHISRLLKEMQVEWNTLVAQQWPQWRWQLNTVLSCEPLSDCTVQSCWLFAFSSSTQWIFSKVLWFFQRSHGLVERGFGAKQNLVQTASVPLSEWPWTGSVTFLSCSSLICKMGLAQRTCTVPGGTEDKICSVRHSIIGSSYDCEFYQKLELNLQPTKIVKYYKMVVSSH